MHAYLDVKCDKMISQCAICLEDAKDNNTQQVTHLQCSHRFHTRCIDTWIIIGGSTCPMCRAAITKIEIRNRSYLNEVLWHIVAPFCIGTVSGYFLRSFFTDIDI